MLSQDQDCPLVHQREELAEHWQLSLIATLCCSPPDNRPGRHSALFVRPTIVKSCIERSTASSRKRPLNICGIIIFSSAKILAINDEIETQSRYDFGGFGLACAGLPVFRRAYFLSALYHHLGVLANLQYLVVWIFQNLTANERFHFARINSKTSVNQDL